jgi:hypothetical protein
MTARGPHPHETQGRGTPLDPSLARVVRRVRLRAMGRADWLRSLWRVELFGESGAASNGAVSHAEVDLHLDDRDTPEAEAGWIRANADSTHAKGLAEVEAEIAADETSRLAHLCRIFVLGPVERDLLHCCVAAALDPALPRVYAYLQDQASRTYASDALVGRLFGHGRSIYLDSDSALLRWGLVAASEPAPGEPHRYVLDDAIRDWLLGSDALDEELHGIASVQPPMPELAGWPVKKTVADLSRWLGGEQKAAVRVRLVGMQGSGRRSFAALVAAKFGLPLLAIDVAAAPEDSWPRLYVKAQRRAFLNGAALAFCGDAFYARRRPETIAHFPLEFHVAESLRAGTPDGRAIDYLVELAPPSSEARRALWRLHAPWSASWPAQDFEAVVAQHHALPADFVRLGRRGPSGPAEAAALLRETARESLGDLAQRIECPFAREDLVLPAQVNAALDDLLFEATQRAQFWERREALRLFPQGRGLLALFSGPPGTGKTMSAQVIAAKLGVDLFRIDLAAVVSKWVGETSKHLARVLAQAAQHDVVLLFDEADALFGRRTEIKDANDRFANTDTSYLLQAIESYRGIALLSTNRKGDIDQAFLRRLRYVLDYPLPDEAERCRILHRIVAELAEPQQAQALSRELDTLGAAVEASGAQLKFAVLSAIFAARRQSRPLAVADVLRGLERELAKEGRPIGERVRERIGIHAV